MELYLGGAFQGKLEYVKSLCGEKKIQIFGKNDFEKLCSLENSFAIWNDFHLTIKNLLEKSETAKKNSQDLNSIFQKKLTQEDFEKSLQEKIKEQILEIIKKNPKIKIISCEIGSGIVPVTRQDRIWRDFSGHLLVLLAKKAEKVERIVCGIPQKLK